MECNQNAFSVFVIKFVLLIICFIIGVSMSLGLLFVSVSTVNNIASFNFSNQMFSQNDIEGMQVLSREQILHPQRLRMSFYATAVVQSDLPLDELRSKFRHSGYSPALPWGDRYKVSLEVYPSSQLSSLTYTYDFADILSSNGIEKADNIYVICLIDDNIYDGRLEFRCF